MTLPEELCDLSILVNGHHRFFLHQKVVSCYSGKLRKANSSRIDFDDFPGGPEGFELVSRFCYSNGKTVRITVQNVSILHCCAVFLEMTEKIHPFNLLERTQNFLEGMFYWSWHEILTSLKTCEPFFHFADSCGLITKLMNFLLAKILRNSNISLLLESPDTQRGSRASSYSSSSSRNSWWFEDMAVLSPRTIEKFVNTLGAFRNENNLIVTKFLLYYLKRAAQCKNSGLISRASSSYSGIAETAVHRVILKGKTGFSCRNLFWVMRIVSGFGVSKDCRDGLERVIGRVLEQATLDDLLVCGHNGSVYDVNLVLRLIRVFVHHNDNNAAREKMIRVGRLIDRYLGEISPDQSLKISRFLAIAESLPDHARDCFDGVYRAIYIYLESHPTLSFEERSRLCRCLNYEKLSLETCKELAKNPRIPPRIAVQALSSQRPNEPSSMKKILSENPGTQIVLYNNKCGDSFADSGHLSEGQKSDDLRVNLERMQWRVVELEKICKEMKGQMTKMVKSGTIIPTPSHGRALPRLC
ncbi:unnamed protein product [Cuscuta europaea]|uniref:NPH3 domain-containing protein n=1 Tax=Cuscuta europaea TaxID=41803 RepID=A0A9P0ZKS7_CUSEU|nr:unnamed protein product [Cuscuta europaea]